MSFTYTNDPKVADEQTPNKNVHIKDLQANYKTVESSVSFSPTYSVTFGDTTLTAEQTKPAISRITELRSAVNTLEAKFSGNCNCNNCCQTQCACQSQCTCQSQCKNCNCFCSSCFPPGTKVLMADYAWKNIEDVKAGEYVIGIENEPLLVRASVGLRLGPWQHMMEFPDKSLVFSSEHAFWIKGKDEKQWWGSNDIHHWLREERELGDYWLREEEELTSKLPDEMHVNFGILEPMPIILTGHEFYAHIDGWKQHDPITIRDRMYSDDYILRHLITEKSHTYIANGYVVSGNISDTNGEYDHTKTDWKGLVRKHG